MEVLTFALFPSAALMRGVEHKLPASAGANAGLLGRLTFLVFVKGRDSCRG